MSKDFEAIKELEKRLGIEIEIRRAPQPTADFSKKLSRAIALAETEEKGFANSHRMSENSIFRTYIDFDNAKGTECLAISDENKNITRLYLHFEDVIHKTRSLIKTLIGRSPAGHVLAPVVWLQNLEFLTLYRLQELESLPENFSGLSKLSVVYLNGLGINRLPESLVGLPSLKELKCYNLNYLQTPPTKIYAQGLHAIRNYYDARKHSSGVDYLYEAKMVVVGRGFAGKTSLVMRLTDPNFQLKRVLPSTEGIEIAEWDLPMRLEHGNHFRFNIWDFGGQEKYDATHQFFITERTLYLFVTEARQESNWLDFDYWLNIIHMLGDNSPVIVVQNKIDQRCRQLPSERYKNEFPNIFDFANVSCAEGYEQTVEGLRELIQNAVKTLPQLGDELPGEWVKIRWELEALEQDHIPYSDYLAICAKHQQNKERADWLSRYFHDLGIIVHYAGDPLLQQLLVINPDWAVDGVYNVLDTPIVEHNKGRFTDKDLEEIWKEAKYAAMRPQLLALMKNYQLCFELGTSGTYIVPELLSVNPIHYDPIGIDGRLTFHYSFSFLPAGLLTRFIVKIHQLIDSDLFWRHGVLVVREGSRALIEEHEIKREIHIAVEGPTKAELLAIIRERFAQIFNEFQRRIEYQEQIPCICASCQKKIIAGQKPYFYNWQTVRRYHEQKIQKIRCEDSLLEVSVAELMGDIDTRIDGFQLPGVTGYQLSQQEAVPETAPAIESTSNQSGEVPKDKIAIGAFGLVFIIVLLILALFVPEPTPFQLFVFRVVLALSAAGVGAFIPGMIEANVKKWIRATGAAALFVVVYMINPPVLVAETEKSPQQKTSEQAE